METIDRVASIFAENAQVQSEALQIQAEAIAAAANCIVSSLLGGGKVLSCGNSISGVDAQYFATLMQHRFERERPGLPAIALNSDTTTLATVACDEGFDAVFAKQISTLGHPGDVLLALTARDTAESFVRAAAAAQERQMPVILLTGVHSGLSGLPGDNVIEIRAPATSVARTLENHRLVLHCLCDLIDLQLMGG